MSNARVGGQIERLMARVLFVAFALYHSCILDLWAYVFGVLGTYVFGSLRFLHCEVGQWPKLIYECML